MILAERAARQDEASLRLVRDIEIERLRLEIARLKRARFGPSAERSARLEQLELALEDLEETAAVVEASTQTVDQSDTQEVRAVTRRRPARRPLPEHLPRHHLVHPGPAACPCCGGTTFSKLGEDVTESLERLPARWHVIQHVQHVREKLSCRSYETISQAPAPFHPISCGRAGPNLLAEVVFAKFGLRLPLHRQSERFAREGAPLEVSTLADWVDAVSVALAPLIHRIERHVRATASQRDAGAGAREGQDPHRPALDGGARRLSLWRVRIRRQRPNSTRRIALVRMPSASWRALPGSCRRMPSRAVGVSMRQGTDTRQGALPDMRPVKGPTL